MLRALGDRFRKTGEPAGLTMIHPIAAGDMYGIAGVDHIAEPGLIKRIVAGSYPSGPSGMASPKIWQMIDDDVIEAYNLPSGVLYHMHADAAAGRPGVLTKIGLDTFVDPRRQGGRMNSATGEDIVRVVEFDGEEWLYYRAIPIDVAIVRGTTADERGNISMEHEGAYLGGLDQVSTSQAHWSIGWSSRQISGRRRRPITTRRSAARCAGPRIDLRHRNGDWRKSSPAARRWSWSMARSSISALAFRRWRRASCSKRDWMAG
jgi:acyl CoA:acetate/3-ketoacid CoA transferase